MCDRLFSWFTSQQKNSTRIQPHQQEKCQLFYHNYLKIRHETYMSLWKISVFRYSFPVTWKYGTLLNYSYCITRFIYTIMHNSNFMSFLFLKMGFLLLNAEWDQSFNFCSKSHRGEGWMWLSASQRNISLVLRCPFPFYSSLTKMIHSCLYEGFTSSQCLESIWCIKCVLPLVKRINAKQMLSPKLTATPSSPHQCILAFLLHPQSYLYTSSKYIPSLLRCKDRESFFQFHWQIPVYHL